MYQNQLWKSSNLIVKMEKREVSGGMFDAGLRTRRTLHKNVNTQRVICFAPSRLCANNSRGICTPVLARHQGRRTFALIITQKQYTFHQAYDHSLHRLLQ